MPRFDCEVYGIVFYTPDLGYHELYAMEEALMAGLQSVFEAHEAEHVDFWGVGDALKFQCAFELYDGGKLKELAQSVAGLLGEHVAGKMVCVETHLEELQVYLLQPGRVREALVHLPDAFTED